MSFRLFRRTSLRPISEKRQLVEVERHEHTVKRGKRSWFHFENMPWLIQTFKFLVRSMHLREYGYRNALDVCVENVELEFENLPAAFDGTRILFVTDTHINAFEELAGRILNLAVGLDYDFCILGGDYSFGYRQESGLAYLRMQELAKGLVAKSPVFGVLGNHDRYRMGETLEECGVQMLINDNAFVERNGDRIYIVGLDDCHYYRADDIELAQEGISGEPFRIMVSHSPELYRTAADAGFSLYLAGHTHGGQVCLPGGKAIVTCATVPAQMVKGTWQYEKMQGYTSRGAGASGVAVRFFCQPEITIITLRKA